MIAAAPSDKSSDQFDICFYFVKFLWHALKFLYFPHIFQFPCMKLNSALNCVLIFAKVQENFKQNPLCVFTATKKGGKVHKQ